MDDIDIKILLCLKENARMNASQISERINLSVSAVIERIKKMEHSGVIRGYTVLLDNKRIGKDVAAFIYICLEHPKFNDNFIEKVQRHNDITECYYVAGDYDFLLKVTADSMEDLTAVLTDIKSISGVSLTRTSIVFATHKNELTVIPQAQK
ncbi:MAG: Lrp/AsnC family transcriptional regulator [Firmicutes bacterium]|nr:Lrp/AsnC family transcriptional regulator [Bacillota bacterium]